MPTAAATPLPQQARVVVARQMVHKTVVELEQKELELQAARCEVAELKVELGAAKAGHAAEDACLLRRRRGGCRRDLALPRQ
ncbi:hypothetical protein ACP70R_044423 [Stipagrostis hirtigluma subsp. patula]